MIEISFTLTFTAKAKILNIADINECEELRPCQAGCDNTIGSYQCKCPTGFQLISDGRSCEGKFLCLNSQLMSWDKGN